jgi:translation initiation factor 4A
MEMPQDIETCEGGDAIKAYVDFDSMPLFEDGSESAIKLLQGVLGYGFEKPSAIQQRAIMCLADHYNVIGQGQSGTGKTGSFVIGALSRYDPAIKNVQLIFLAHTHELAQQIIAVVRSIGSRLFSEENVELCVGQCVSVDQNIENIKKGKTQILVGTPGRICDLMERQIRVNGKQINLINPAFVKTLIIDEADKLLSQKFEEKMNNIVCALDNPNLRKDNLQVGIFSATLSETDLECARDLCIPKRKSLENWKQDPRAPKEILVPVEDLTLDGIEQFYYNLESPPRESFADKVRFIRIMNEIRVVPQCIIYVNNQDTARNLSRSLYEEGLETRCIYGKMAPSERLDITTEFRKGTIRILVATDLLSRGFDVQQVSLVINFDIPYVTDRNTGRVNEDSMAEYLHRIGRSGRFGRKGLAINLVANINEMHRVETIRDFYKTDIKLLQETDISGGLLY